MNRKITDFALGLKCGGLAASAFTRSRACAGGSSSDARAIAPKPCAARTSTSRRVTAGRKWESSHCGHLWDIDKLVPVQQCQAHVGQVSAAREELRRQITFRG